MVYAGFRNARRDIPDPPPGYPGYPVLRLQLSMGYPN